MGPIEKYRKWRNQRLIRKRIERHLKKCTAVFREMLKAMPTTAEAAERLGAAFRGMREECDDETD